MNKEIEELLNNFQEILENPTTTEECYDGRIIEIDRSYDLEPDEIKALLSYIEQLEKENKILKDNAEHNDKVVDKVNWENQQLKKQKDDVVEYIRNNKYKQYAGRNEFTCEIQYSDYVIKADDLLRMLGEIDVED